MNGIKEFWQTTLEELRGIPLDAAVERDAGRSTPFVTAYSVRLKSWGEVFVRGRYYVPDDDSKKPFPALLTLPGYSGQVHTSIEFAQMGYAVLVLYPRGQGESAEGYRIQAPTHLLENLMDRDQYYYRGAYVDCVRGVEFLLRREEVATERIGVVAASQGAGLGLATAALEQRVKVAALHIPFLCNFGVAVDVATAGPYLHLREYFEEHPHERDVALKVLEYFDPLKMAEWIECPVLLSIGMKDATCPYETIMPVFEKIRSVKGLMLYPDLPHKHSLDFLRHQLNWVERYL